jgi:hypothetical protein
MCFVWACVALAPIYFEKIVTTDLHKEGARALGNKKRPFSPHIGPAL